MHLHGARLTCEVGVACSSGITVSQHESKGIRLHPLKAAGLEESLEQTPISHSLLRNLVSGGGQHRRSRRCGGHRAPPRSGRGWCSCRPTRSRGCSRSTARTWRGTQHKAYMKGSGLRELCSASAGCLAEHGAAQQCQRIGTTS